MRVLCILLMAESAALKLNVRLAREKFDQLQAGSVYAPT